MVRGETAALMRTASRVWERLGTTLMVRSIRVDRFSGGIT